MINKSKSTQIYKSFTWKDFLQIAVSYWFLTHYQVKVMVNQNGKKVYRGKVLSIHNTVDHDTGQARPLDQWRYKVKLHGVNKSDYFNRSQILPENKTVERSVESMNGYIQSRNQRLTNKLRESYTEKKEEMEKLVNDIRDASRYVGAVVYCRRLWI